MTAPPPPVDRPGEPKQRQLYEFDWQLDWTVGEMPKSGTEQGWWNGQHWVGLYGDGMWSPCYVTGFRPLSIRRAARGVSE